MALLSLKSVHLNPAGMNVYFDDIGFGDFKPKAQLLIRKSGVALFSLGEATKLIFAPNCHLAFLDCKETDS